MCDFVSLFCKWLIMNELHGIFAIRFDENIIYYHIIVYLVTNF